MKSTMFYVKTANGAIFFAIDLPSQNCGLKSTPPLIGAAFSRGQHV
jgi:hypothetical protein